MKIINCGTNTCEMVGGIDVVTYLPVIGFTDRRFTEVECKTFKENEKSNNGLLDIDSLPDDVMILKYHTPDALTRHIEILTQYRDYMLEDLEFIPNEEVE